MIIKSLLEGEKAFSKIKNEVSGISSRILSQRLLEMEKLNILKRNVYTESPIKVEYSLIIKEKLLKELDWIDKRNDFI